MTAWRDHVPEYAAEALGLGLFMVSACGFGVLLFHPGYPGVRLIPDAFLRGALMGAAMGLTAIVNIYSPWGRRSGAHLNPAVTLAFLRLGKVRRTDAIGYVVAQFAGALAGTGVGVLLFLPAVGDPAVNYVATLPGTSGALAAFGAELVISFGLMLAVLGVSSRPRLAPYTGVTAGVIVMLYIMFEAPISGMSMNPARSVGSAAYAATWTGIWLYLTAPPLGMLMAAELFTRSGDARRGFCAKLDHANRVRCIFCGHVPR